MAACQYLDQSTFPAVVLPSVCLSLLRLVCNSCYCSCVASLLLLVRTCKSSPLFWGALSTLWYLYCLVFCESSSVLASFVLSSLTVWNSLRFFVSNFLVVLLPQLRITKSTSTLVNVHERVKVILSLDPSRD
jgi:hypothetical protein